MNIFKKMALGLSVAVMGVMLMSNVAEACQGGGAHRKEFRREGRLERRDRDGRRDRGPRQPYQAPRHGRRFGR